VCICCVSGDASLQQLPVAQYVSVYLLCVRRCKPATTTSGPVCKCVFAVCQAMQACNNYQWPSMRVELLDRDQKEQIITEYLEGIYGKTLTRDQKDKIINSDQTSNALYLKSLLDEVCLP